MKLSTERILTTHVGSLARPPDLFDMIAARASGQPYDAVAFETRVRLQDHVRSRVIRIRMDRVGSRKRARRGEPQIDCFEIANDQRCASLFSCVPSTN